jgi:hypothetical protein
VAVKRGSLLFVVVIGTVVGATALLPGSAVRLATQGGFGRAIPGGAEPSQRPTAGVAVRSHLLTPTRQTGPTVLHLTRARSAVFDVRTLHGTVVKQERAEVGDAGGADATAAPGGGSTAAQPNLSTSSPAPAPDSSFAGLDFATWGAGHPPDDNGDVGPTYYIQTVNTAIGIYDKSTGNRVAAFTFNAFMSQGHFGNLCDTNNFGDPVVLYDSFEDRWFISDFAFKLDSFGNIVAPVYQCFAVSKTGDPVLGGWNFYSIQAPGALDDYPKFAVWPDGIYMSANMFGVGSSGSYISPHVWALDKQQMYAGAPSPEIVDFVAPSADFTLLPANARLQTGTPPAGTPEYFVSTWDYLNAQTVYKFHVDWDKISTSTFTGPDVQNAPNCWPNANVANALTPANSLDTLQIRAMAQAQYTNLGGAESIWIAHTVNRGTFTLANCGGANSNNATIRWYQLNVTGGTVAANDVQGATFDPDVANTFFRFMPALAVDRAGDMAVVYSKSNSTTNPQIKYAGRLAGDPANTFGQGEQTLIDGTGSQSGNCGSSACTRWGDYSGMALDPNGCEFWLTDEYYLTTGLNDQTRIGSFHYPGCTPVGSGTLSGTVTDGTNPISGATVALGSRTTTTDSGGNYSFTVPAGTYPTLSAGADGFDPSSAASLAVPDGGTLTHNFTLGAAAQSGCFTDNSQNTFQTGVPNGCDLVASPGSVVLGRPDNTDAANSSVTTNGFGFSTTSWAGQTFTPTVTGQLKRVDVELFCSGCSGTNPDITLSIRATTGTTPVPTGSDLASTTLAGFNDGGAGGLKTFTFASPITLTAGTRYAFIFRANAARTGIYAYTCSCSPDSSPYASGQRVTSTTSGSTWTADTTTGGRDLHFITYINPGYASSGTFVSSVKDVNPAPGYTPVWTTLSFSDTTPVGTAVKFQVATSNSQYGPFSFVGPDGTASTYFTTSGADLGEFDGFRYLRYKAFLSTADPALTPSISSVSVCFNETPPPPVALTVTARAHVPAGVHFLLHASAVDAHGNVVTGYSDPAAVVTDSAAQVPPGTTMAIVDGVGQVSLTIPQPLKNETFTVTSGSLTGTSPNVHVFGPLASITVTKAGPFHVGTPYGVSASAYDSAGNLLTNYNGSATESDLAGGSAATSFSNGRLSTQLTATSPSKADVVTVTSGSVSGESSSFKVYGPFAQMVMYRVGPFAVGTPYTVNASAEDAAGNLLLSYSGSATVSDLCGGNASGSFSSGKLSVQLTPTSPSKADEVTIDSGGVTATSPSFKVYGPLAQVKVMVAGPFVHGSPYTVTAWAEDAAGNILTGYSGSADVSDLDGGSASGSFSNGKLIVQLTPTAARSDNQVTVTTGGISGTSVLFRVT